MKIFETIPGLLLTEKNCFVITGCTFRTTDFTRRGTCNSNSVPNTIYNDPDPHRASGSFLFSGENKKYFSNPDHDIMQHEQVLSKNIIEKKLFVNLNYEHEK